QKFSPALVNARGWAVNGLDLQLRPGDIVFITGGNGVGKTTLLKAMAGLYPSAKGRVVLQSMQGRSRELTSSDLRNIYSGVFAESRLPLPYPHELSPSLQESICRVGLKEKFDPISYSKEKLRLSFGEHRRLDLAYALAEDKWLLCFDETGANQSPEFKREFYTRIIPSLAKKNGNIVIVASHDREYFKIASQQVILGNDVQIICNSKDNHLSDTVTSFIG
ncbi:MAG: ATP-binding cassette domain-containing protein, partial [Pseudomonadales bacterium]|nr:ATP-binding cassette domain-containing protein [Pseudomonadales bacterium]